MAKTRVYACRFERGDGNFREINVPATSEQAALELAERRLAEQFGDMCFKSEEQRRQIEEGYSDPGAELLRTRPDLHQDNYRLVSVVRV